MPFHLYALELGHFKPPSFFYGAENFPIFKALSFLLWSITHQKLPGCTKPKKKKKFLWVEINFLGWFCGVGNIYLKLTFLPPELTLPQFYSFLHEMERVRTSMECFSWFLSPCISTFALPCCLRFCGWLLWEAPHSQAGGALIWPSLLLGSPGAKASEKQQD